MRTLLLAGLTALLSITGCKSFAYQCASSSECTRAGESGTCESTGYCSFIDPSCDSGRRYGEYASGSYAGACVGDTTDVDAAIDSRMIDAREIDAPPGAVTASFGETGNATFTGVTIDTEISDGSTGNENGGDHVSVDLGTTEAGLIRFDISAIPTNVTVLDAKVELETTGDGSLYSAGTARIFRLLESWVESEVTGVSRFNGQLWGTVNADPPNSRDAAMIGEFAPTTEGRFIVPLTTAVVQAWVTNPAANNGFILDANASTGHLHICSKEHPTAAKRPRLVIIYQP